MRLQNASGRGPRSRSQKWTRRSHRIRRFEIRGMPRMNSVQRRPVVLAVDSPDRHELPSIKESALQQEILQVVETAQSVYFMVIVYDEGDIGSAVGNVFAFSGERQPGIVPTQLLVTNDTLRV